ncbi:MAG: hypothetical protein AB2L07_11705 [Thermoanaerobaculaceae bacterium]
MTTITKTVVLAVAYALASSAAGQEPPCRAYRLAVRAGIDPGVRQIDLGRARKVSLSDLQALPTPDPSTVDEGRRSPAEKQLYRIRGTLVQQRTGDRRDYALVITDEKDRKLVVEIPAPPCVPAESPFFGRLSEAFRALDGRLHMDEQSLQVGLAIPVEITGVGFFDLEYLGSTDLPSGMAPNLFELNPVLDVKFK